MNEIKDKDNQKAHHHVGLYMVGVMVVNKQMSFAYKLSIFRRNVG